MLNFAVDLSDFLSRLPIVYFVVSISAPSLDRFKLLEGLICPFYVPIEPFEAGGAKHKLIKLAQRSWTKSCRDSMVYIIRLPVYFGLSTFMGIIWFPSAAFSNEY